MREPHCNKLIAQLPASLRIKLQTVSRVMTLHSGQELSLSGQAGNYAYFPETALLSLSQVLASSVFTEIMTVGGEGMLTAPGYCEDRTNLVALVLTGGSAVRVAQIALRELAGEHAQLQSLLTTYNDYTTQQLYQVIACYRHHSIKQQLSRWLLAYDDRYPNAPIRTTHAILAKRLGVRREAVSTVASFLQEAGALHYHRGQIDWINRPLLLTHSCDCYKALHSIEQKKAQQFLLSSASHD